MTETPLEANGKSKAARAVLLARASQAFSMVSRDLEVALRTAVQRIADGVGGAGCMIGLLSPDRKNLETLASYHPSPEIRSAIETLLGQPRPADTRADGLVALQGKPVLLPIVNHKELKAISDPLYHEFLETFPIRSLLIVPLHATSGVIGSLSLARFAPDHPFTQEDQQLVQDLADRAAMAIENARLFQEAQQAIALRDEFLSIASHELRTPLTALQLTLESLADLVVTGGHTGNEIGRKTTQANRQVERLSRLINSLLDLARMRAGGLELKPEKTYLLALAKEIAEQFEVEAAHAHCTLDVSGVEAQGLWDKLRIEQVLTNLVANAIKYAAGSPITIDVEKSDADHALLLVRDRGPGMSHDDLERIFGRFERASSAQGHGGLGLGLYLARQIVEAHGGSIHADSSPDQGTTFTVRLPTRTMPHAHDN